jgi:hypothetical protein
VLSRPGTPISGTSTIDTGVAGVDPFGGTVGGTVGDPGDAAVDGASTGDAVEPPAESDDASGRSATTVVDPGLGAAARSSPDGVQATSNNPADAATAVCAAV